MALSGRTQVAAVIGDPVEHSLSPAILNAAFAAADLDWAFVAFTVGLPVDSPASVVPVIAALRSANSIPVFFEALTAAWN